MKKIKILLIAFFLFFIIKNNLFATDTLSIKYFPLAVGNVYKYHYTSSVGYNYYYKVRYIKDTIINSKRYFVINQSFPGYIGVILRCDSMTGNIYSRKVRDIALIVLLKN